MYRFSFGGAEITTRQVEDACDRLHDALSDLRPVWRRAGTIMRRSFAQNFREGGRPQPWKPLSPNTVFAKTMLGGDLGFAYSTDRGKARIRRLEQRFASFVRSRTGVYSRSMRNILIARGDLRDSYAQKNRNHISRVRKDGFEEGSKHWLANWHEYGTDPYDIRPRTAGVLSFFIVGGRAYATFVRHPGLPARPAGIYQAEDIDQIMSAIGDHLAAGS